MAAEPVLGTADLRRSNSCFMIAEPLDADLLKDLRGLGKPPTFDGNDADYQDFRFSFRIHMSHVSAVSHTLMDKFGAEWNQITLAAVKAPGERHLKMLHTDALFVGFDHGRKLFVKQRHGWHGK